MRIGILKRFACFRLKSFIYHHEAIFPFTDLVENQSRSIAIALRRFYLDPSEWKDGLRGDQEVSHVRYCLSLIARWTTG